MWPLADLFAFKENFDNIRIMEILENALHALLSSMQLLFGLLFGPSYLDLSISWNVPMLAGHNMVAMSTFLDTTI